MDLATIETVLRANNGAVDATIDQLLTLTEDLPDTGPSTPPNMGGAEMFGMPPPTSQLGPASPTPQMPPNLLMGHSPPPVRRLQFYFNSFLF